MAKKSPLLAIWDAIVRFVGTREAPPEPVSPPKQLEEFAFPEQRTGAPPNKNLVIDFGTTATVAAITYNDVFQDQKVFYPLVGMTEQTSELVLNQVQDEVIFVGRGSYEAWTKSGSSGHYYESLKRYMELLSRQKIRSDGSRSDAGSILPPEIVGQYLEKSMRAGFDDYREKHADMLGKKSEVIVSVPNSFNPQAVDWIAEGVISALNNLGAPIERGQIHIVRESDAVGYAVLRSRSLGLIPTGDGTSKAPMRWNRIDQQAQPVEQVPLSQGDGFVVLDIGGGTTDLTLFRVDSESAGHVEFNCGVPIGGSDIDKLVLGAHLLSTVRRDFGAWSKIQRRDPILQIRSVKDATSGEFFFGKDPNALPQAYRDSDEVMRKILTEAPPNQMVGGTTDLLLRGKCEERLNLYLKLSIGGLIAMIPSDVLARNLKGFFLTGRACQLVGIRSAVCALALPLNVPVYTLEHPYHLKLIVSCGMALQELPASGRLPAGTFGKRLRQNPGQLSVEPGFPVSGEAPTVFRVRLRGAPRKHNWWEFRSHPDELKKSLGGEDLELIGVARMMATTESEKNALNLLWNPVHETYYSSSAGSEWVAHEPMGVSPDSVNGLTGLSLGWPYHPKESV